MDIFVQILRDFKMSKCDWKLGSLQRNEAFVRLVSRSHVDLTTALRLVIFECSERQLAHTQAATEQMQSAAVLFVTNTLLSNLIHFLMTK